MEESYTLTRQTEIGMALPVLSEAAEAYRKALSLTNDLALVLAEDNGIPFDPVVDRAQFTVDEEGIVTLRIFYPCDPEPLLLDSGEQGESSAREQLDSPGPLGAS